MNTVWVALKERQEQKAERKNMGRQFYIYLLLLGGLLRRLRHLATRLVSLVDRLDDTDSHSLSHVTNGETTQRWVFIVGLDTHGLRGDKLDNTSITRLDELRRRFERLATPTVDLLDQLSKLAGNVGSVTVKHWSITSTDLTRVVEDDDLSIEGSSLLGGVVLGVGSNISTTNILDGNVLDVETDVVSGKTLNKLLVVHFDGLDFSSHVRRSEGDDHASLDDTSLDTTDGHSTNTTDLVDILKGETKGLVGGTNQEVRWHQWRRGGSCP